jgi:phytoene dehydrogenase-like protein|tara:strand:+ start:539 stop:2146 length:1608 start_codon:yes stop_codon:yes gene_type:complete
MHKVVIIGAGHNGLVCSCYLARAGMAVTLLEGRHLVGGSAITDEFHPGFRNSVASYTVSLLHPKVIRDLHLVEHGLRIVSRPISNYLPLANGGGFVLYPDAARTQQELARFSKRDAGQLPAYYEMLSSSVDLVRQVMMQSPPVMANGGVGDIVTALKMANRLRRLSLHDKQSLLNLFTKSAGEILDGYFESDPIKAAFGFDSVVGSFASPYSPGSAYGLLHHVLGETNGVQGSWGHALGGMGSITQAMLREAQKLAVEVKTNVTVIKVKVADERVQGVVLGDGSEIEADVVVSSVNPKVLFLQLIEADQLDPSVLTHFDRYQNCSASFRMNVALAEAPRFEDNNASRDPEHLQAGIILAPSLRYMEEAHTSAKRNGWSDKPIIEVLIPSTIDDSLAPANQHVASLFCQHFDPYMAAGWEDCKERVADLIIDTVNDYAPNFRDQVLGRMVLSPLDLEEQFGLTGGDISHGRMSLDQLYSARPMLGMGNYRSPIGSLYMCGAGTHPGGGVSGIPGHNAAREILNDSRAGFSRWTKRQ